MENQTIEERTEKRGRKKGGMNKKTEIRLNELEKITRQNIMGVSKKDILSECRTITKKCLGYLIQRFRKESFKKGESFYAYHDDNTKIFKNAIVEIGNLEDILQKQHKVTVHLLTSINKRLINYQMTIENAIEVNKRLGSSEIAKQIEEAKKIIRIA